MFALGSFHDGMQVDGSLPLASYLLYTFQHSSKLLRSKFSQAMATINNNGENMGRKLDVGVDENI